MAQGAAIRNRTMNLLRTASLIRINKIAGSGSGTGIQTIFEPLQTETQHSYRSLRPAAGRVMLDTFTQDNCCPLNYPDPERLAHSRFSGGRANTATTR